MGKADRIAGVVLTKNEAPNLRRCVESLRWCDEVLVVDSGSTDGTQALARELGVRILEHRQDPPFRIDRQRNWALEHGGLSSAWVLFLDADETVPPALAAELRRAIGDDGVDAYELTPRYLFWGTWLRRTQGYPNWHPRFVRRGRVHFEGGVWEHFSAGARVGRIRLPYEHYANSKGLRDWLDRHDRYSTWDADKVSAFLESGQDDALGTTRKRRLRIWAARLWPIRPLARFLQMYVLRLGFLEGRAALVFCLLYFFYELMTVVKIVERRRLRAGLPL